MLSVTSLIMEDQVTQNLQCNSTPEMTVATSLGQRCTKLKLKTLSMKCEKRSEKKGEDVSSRHN
jgi:hypothetical protein